MADSESETEANVIDPETEENVIDHPMEANANNPVMEANSFLKLAAARNICAGAYREITRKVLEAKHIELPPVLGLGSLKFLDEMFSSPPPEGMRVQCSVETATFPVQSKILISVMMNINTWASSLPELICRASDNDLTGFFKQLVPTEDKIVDVKMVDAEVRLPTHLCETRKFSFLRFQWNIIGDTWAIIDLSYDYFLDSRDGLKSERICRRRPSGVVIRGQGSNSEVIWIENVEVYESMLENSIYTSVLDSNIAFCAKHWVSTLYHKMYRNDTKNFKQNMSVDWKARSDLIFSQCDRMKVIFSECLHEYPDEHKICVLPDEGKMNIISDEHGIRILNDPTTIGYIGLTSFLVKAKPISVFHYLINKDMQLEWPGIEHKLVGEQIMHITENPYNRITLYSESDYTKIPISKCVLQEISRDDFCSYVISASLTQEDAKDLLCDGMWPDIPMHPTGFAIMPEGPGGLHSDASLVTIVVHKKFDEYHDAVHAIDMMIDYVTTTMGDIEEYVAERDEDGSKTC